MANHDQVEQAKRDGKKIVLRVAANLKILGYFIGFNNIKWLITFIIG